MEPSRRENTDSPPTLNYAAPKRRRTATIAQRNRAIGWLVALVALYLALNVVVVAVSARVGIGLTFGALAFFAFVGPLSFVGGLVALQATVRPFRWVAVLIAIALVAVVAGINFDILRSAAASV